MAKKSHPCKKYRLRAAYHETLVISRNKYEHLIYADALLRAVREYVSAVKDDVSYVDVTPLRMLLGIHPMPESLRNLFSKDVPEQPEQPEEY